MILLSSHVSFFSDEVCMFLGLCWSKGFVSDVVFLPLLSSPLGHFLSNILRAVIWLLFIPRMSEPIYGTEPGFAREVLAGKMPPILCRANFSHTSSRMPINYGWKMRGILFLRW